MAFLELKRVLDFEFPPVVKIPVGCGRCLDIGCGSGRDRERIQAAGYQWIGVDIDTSRGQARLIEADIHSLPFESGSFNLVWMNCVLEHVRNPWQALSEVNRILKRGGYLAGINGYLDPDSTHYFGLTYLGLNQVLADNNFVQIETQPATTAFPVILRKWLVYFIGNKAWSTRIAFVICKLLFVPLYIGCSLYELGKSIFLDQGLTVYRSQSKQRSRDIHRDFAAYFTFSARKGEEGKSFCLPDRGEESNV